MPRRPQLCSLHPPVDVTHFYAARKACGEAPNFDQTKMIAFWPASELRCIILLSHSIDNTPPSRAY